MDGERLLRSNTDFGVLEPIGNEAVFGNRDP